MKPKVKSYSIITGADNNIAESQTPAAGGSQALTLNGALAVGGVIPLQDLGYIILLTAAGDESARTFTVTGADVDGAAQTEEITGPNATTGVGTKFFRSISSVTVDDDTAGAVEVGTPNTTLVALTPTYALDIYSGKTSIAVNISGTINYDLLKCFERPTAGDALNFVAGGLTAKTADDNTAYDAPVGGIRVEINSYTNGATLKVAIAQERAK